MLKISAFWQGFINIRKIFMHNILDAYFLGGETCSLFRVQDCFYYLAQWLVTALISLAKITEHEYTQSFQTFFISAHFPGKHLHIGKAIHCIHRQLTCFWVLFKTGSKIHLNSISLFSLLHV